MPQPVPISAIIDGMETQSEEMHSYLHRPTGRVLIVSDDAFNAAEEDDEEWVTPEELEEARSILGAEDDYLELPDRYEIDEYNMMERFAGSLEDDRDRQSALASLHGRGAFRRFKDLMHSLGLIDEWYRYRDERYRQVARSWCQANGIDFDDTAPSDA